MKTIKILIADDSAIIRAILEKQFSGENGFEIAASVSNGRKAFDDANLLKPDFVLCDNDMPEMDGFSAVGKISSELKIPCGIFSENEEDKTKALANGAALFFVKPNLASMKKDFFIPIIQQIKNLVLNSKASESSSAAAIDLGALSACANGIAGVYKLFCIGASTGGPAATKVVLENLGNDFPLPVIYVQHIGEGGDEKMVDWFNSVCPNIPMSLAKDGEVARPGRAYMAPADRHLVIAGINGEGLPILEVNDEPEERFLRPAVNKLFRSAAKFYKNECLAALLTGMGADGAEGCKMIIDNGGRTLVQNKETSVVFGMPSVAIEMGAASEILPLDKIGQRARVLAGGPCAD